MATRTVVLFVFGGLGVAFAVLAGFIGLAMWTMPEEQGGWFWQRRAAFLILGVFTFLPGVVSGIFITIGVKQRARFRRLGELAAIARQRDGHLSTDDVARGLGTTRQLAERVIVDAATLGFIEEGAAAPTHPTAYAHAQPAPMRPSGHLPTPPPPSPWAPTQAGTPPPSPRHAGAQATPEPIGPGTILGGTYRIEEPLGRGGMGAVFAARHLRTGRRYALKAILPGSGGDAASRRFEREATAASALGHPGIVQVHDFNVSDDGSSYLVMDLLEGETLGDRLERTGPLPWPDAQRIALELTAALAAAHEHGLIHRDIKPSNVFLAKTKSASERVVLVDFGLVKSLSESTGLTSTGAVVGTPMYMSPEQARGETLDVRTDVYSLAAVVFEMVTGAPPFLDSTMAAIYARLLREPPPRASQVAKSPVPRALDDVLARALAKDRAARFDGARAFGDALATVGDEAPATARMLN